MLKPRIIPCLLVSNGGLVKTVGFSNPKYVGDPINAVKIFNEKEVDEIIVLNIDATRKGQDPDYGMIRNLARECRMPLCYGGGVRTADQVKRIVGLGVEKVAISSAAIEMSDVISRSAEIVGSQSIVVVLDSKRGGIRGDYGLWTHNGTKRIRQSAVEFARIAEMKGAGEIVVNSIDRDGAMTGYDLDLIRSIRDAIHLPITALGGAGSLQDIEKLIRVFGIIGAAAGSLFVFKGVYRAVLINYPNPIEKRALIAASG